METDNIKMKLSDEINSQFGAFANINCAGFDADVNTIPPVVVDFSEPKDIYSCFTFEEIIVSMGRKITFFHRKGYYKNKKECEVALKNAIEKYIMSVAPSRSDRKKATIVWRVLPEIKFFDDVKCWAGYARLRVLK